MLSENNSMSPADLAAVMGNNNDGFGGNGGWSWWIIILLLFANGGWGNGWGNNVNNGANMGCMVPQYMMNFATNDTVLNGFNQMALSNGLNDITTTLSNGFANAEISRANTLASITGQMNNIAMNQQAGVYQGQLLVANLGALIAQEACADRQAVNDGVRDLMAQNVTNTNAILNSINNGFQVIQNQMYQDKMDSKNETIANLRQQIAMKDLQASQTSQNAFIQQGFTQEVEDLYNRLNSCPVPTTPVFGRTPIFSCQGGLNFTGCGCGN